MDRFVNGEIVARREDFDNSFWDEDDIDALSPWATLLYIWSWTHRRCGMSGVYRVPRHRCTESKVPAEELDGAFAELEDAELLFYRDGWMWVKGRAKRIRPRSTQMAKSVRADLESLPREHPFMVLFLARYGDDQWLREALGDLRVNIKRTSGDLHVNADKQGESVNVTPPSPEVQPNFHGNGKGRDNGKGGLGGPGGRVELPADFPDELRPHLTAVFKVLRSLAERHNAKAVNPLSLASVVMGRPHRPLVKAAHDCAAHWDGKSSHVKDVVAAYRNWLERTDDLEGYEHLDSEGRPASRPRSGPRAVPDNVAQLDAKRLASVRALAEGGLPK